MIKVSVVDSYSLVRKGLLAILSTDSEIVVVGEASNPQETTTLIQQVKPDVCIINNKLEDRCSLAIIKHIKEKGFLCKFVFLTSLMTQEEMLRAEKMGIDGLILKGALPEELLYVIRQVNKGRKYYDPALMGVKLNGSLKGEVEELTSKEREVLTLLGLGLNNKEIAIRLFIKEYIVEKHVSQVLAKLKVTDRAQAASYAHAKGLVKCKRIS